MFTGIICGVGTVVAAGAGAITVDVPEGIAPRLRPGGSVAVNGVCLTVRALTGRRFTADVSGETAVRTTLGRLRPGVRVNLELPLRPEDGLDGHIVLGHVDAIGRVEKMVRRETGWEFVFGYPPEYARYLVEKGSIAVDGISLTAFGVTAARFVCAVIPETYENTNLRDRHPGDAVNLEFDILGKYVERMLNVHHD
jgi:riboflavin synthase